MVSTERGKELERKLEQLLKVAKTPLFTETGERRLLVIVSRNVTERNKVEQKLRDSERKFRMIAEHMRDLLFVVSPQGTIRYASPSVEASLGYGAADLADIRFASLLPVEERAKGERLLAAIWESGGGRCEGGISSLRPQRACALVRGGRLPPRGGGRNSRRGCHGARY